MKTTVFLKNNLFIVIINNNQSLDFITSYTMQTVNLDLDAHMKVIQS